MLSGFQLKIWLKMALIGIFAAGFLGTALYLMQSGAASAWWIAAIGFGMGLLGFTWVALRITQQLQALESTFAEIGLGNFSARSPIVSSDDLGNVTQQFNTMLANIGGFIQSQEDRDRIQENITKLLEEISGVAEGDLTGEAEVTAEVTGAIADSFNMMIAQLRTIIGDVVQTTLEVSSSANEIQTTAENLAEGSEIQTQEIIQASSSIAQMAKSIQEVSQNAVSSAEVAGLALQNATKGFDAVQKTNLAMDNIRQQVQETSKRLKRLGESSQEIGEIVNLISGIAERTSILALNASIQAAMAGEAGRGFAVVAEEVERLADRATEATKQISLINNTIQTETSDAVVAMENTTQEVILGSQLSRDSGQALAEISDVSEKLATLSQTISHASKQQAMGSEAIAKSMEEISQITQQTTFGTQQAAISIVSLAEIADTLRGSVRQFQLP